MEKSRLPHDPVTPGVGNPERVAAPGLLVNALLAIVKLMTGILGHSFALVADAVESMVDIVGSLVVWRALRYGARPPDESHPFGHGKAEALGAMAVGLLIIAAGLGIAAEAVEGIRTPHKTPSAYVLVVLVLVIVVKEAMFRRTRRAAAASGGSAGIADAWHHRSDAIASAGAFIGVTIAVVGGERWARADDWAALLASGVIVFNGVWLLRAPLGELMDVASPEVAAQCREVVLEIAGIRAIEKCEARKTGRVFRVVMHAEVDPSISVTEAHALTGRAKTLVRERMPQVASLLIHIEPHRPE